MAIKTLSGSDLNKLLTEQTPVLVEFYAPWCTYCRRLSPVFERVAEQYGDKLTVGQINIDNEPELAEKYRIELIPTLVMLQGGAPADYLVNPQSKAAIDNLIQQHLTV